jgi:acyltransferase-like protein
MVVEEPSRNLAIVSRNRAEQLPATRDLSPRRYELDWLRAIIVLGAIVFHAIYEIQIYFPQVRSDTLTQIGFTFAMQWGLPLLFLIAGASAWLSLAHRTWQQFLKERVLHLLVPFLGCALTVIPLTLYFASLISTGPHVPLFQFYADYFQRYAQFFQGNPVDNLTALWGNLWFIFVIFLLSLLTLPLIIWLRGPHGVRAISRFATLCRIPGGTLIAGLILIVWSWFLGMVMPTAVASALWIATLCELSFIAGVFLYADPTIEQAVKQDGSVALVLAMLAFGIEQILVITNALPLPRSGGYALSAILAGSIPWCGAIASLGLGKRFLGFTNRTLEYLKEAAFPYFILHMLILSVFAYIFLKHSGLPGILQGAAIISCWALSLALLYEFLIKRTAFLRVIFGMKAQPRA